MGCHYSKENRCYSTTCCFCITGKWACYHIGIVTLIWESFNQTFDYLLAYSDDEYSNCRTCIDHNTNKNLGFASGIISSVQCAMSILLIIGAKKELRLLILLWLIWTSVNLLMVFVWFFYIMPYMPNVRGIATIVKIVWFIHYFIVIKTHYSKDSLNFKEESLSLEVPPSTPTRHRHKRRKIRTDPNHRPVIRTLLAVALKLKAYKESRSVLVEDKETADPPDNSSEHIQVGSNDEEESMAIHSLPRDKDCPPQDGEIQGTFESNRTCKVYTTKTKHGTSSQNDTTSPEPGEATKEVAQMDETETSSPQILLMVRKLFRQSSKDLAPTKTLDVEATGGRKSQKSPIPWKEARSPSITRNQSYKVAVGHSDKAAIKRRKSYKVAVGHNDEVNSVSDSDGQILHITDF